MPKTATLLGRASFVDGAPHPDNAPGFDLVQVTYSDQVQLAIWFPRDMTVRDFVADAVWLRARTDGQDDVFIKHVEFDR